MDPMRSTTWAPFASWRVVASTFLIVVALALFVAAWATSAAGYLSLHSADAGDPANSDDISRALIAMAALGSASVAVAAGGLLVWWPRRRRWVHPADCSS